MRLVESGYMVNYAHTARFATDSFEHTGCEIVFVAERQKTRQKL
jgi:hypothetical protein